ncbi:MAG: hypothetical protein K2X01_05230 [Cyanobacteria bacterium]|nr:hypothetical protein [Cyanobacteriota bacterium]
MDTHLNFKRAGLQPAQPHFTGLSRLIPGRLWLGVDSFERVVSERTQTQGKSAYLGTLPHDWVSLLKNNILGGTTVTPRDVYQALDELAPVLQSLLPISRLRITCRLKKAGIYLVIVKINSGQFGEVFAIQLQQKDKPPSQPLALKVFRSEVNKSGLTKPSHRFIHGTWAEIATGLRWSHRRYKDLVHFYVANPQKDWMLSEWIDSRSTKSRKASGYFTQEGKAFSSDFKDENYIEGIRVDMGGISRIHQNDTDVSWHHLGQYIGSESLEPELMKLPKEKKLTWFKLLIDSHPHNPELVKLLAHLPEEDRYPAFSYVLKQHSENLACQAVFQMKDIPQADRYHAFKLAMDSSFLDVRLAAANRIALLDREVLPEAIEYGLKIAQKQHQHGIEESIIFALPYIDPKKRFAILENLLKDPDPQYHQQGILIIAYLELGERKKAYELILSTENPDLQARAVQKELPAKPEDRYPWFLDRVKHPSLLVKAAVGSHIPNIPKRAIPQNPETSSLPGTPQVMARAIYLATLQRPGCFTHLDHVEIEADQ